MRDTRARVYPGSVQARRNALLLQAERRQRRAVKAFVAVWLAVFVAAFAFWAGAIFVVLHFLGKVW